MQQLCRPDGGNGGSDRSELASFSGELSCQASITGDTLNVEDDPADEVRAALPEVIGSLMQVQLSGEYNEINILDELAHDEVIIA